MIQARSIPFEKSLATLNASPVEARPAPSRAEVREVEMMKLATALLPVFAELTQVSVSVSSSEGYVLRPVGTGPVDLAPAARALAAASGMSVAVLDENNAETRFSAPSVPILLPEKFPNFGARDSIIREIADSFVRRVYPAMDPVAPTISPEKLLADSPLSRFAHVQPVNFGGYELVLGDDLSVLARDEFQQLLGKLVHSPLVRRIMVAPSLQGISYRLDSDLGNSFLWEMRRTDDGSKFAISIDQSSRDRHEEIEPLVQRLSAQIGFPVEISYTPIAKDARVIPPQTASLGQPIHLRIAGANYLFASPLSGGFVSSAITLQVPFKIPNSAVMDFIVDHIDSGSKFVLVQGGASSKRISLEVYFGALEALKQKLELADVRVVKSSNSIVVTLPSINGSQNLRNLALFVDYVQASKSLCPNEVTLHRNSYSDSQGFDFFSQFLNAETLWTIRERSKVTTLETRRPEELPVELADIFRSIFDRALLIQRNPAPLLGQVLPAPLRDSTLRNWSQVQTVMEQLPVLLPKGLGDEVSAWREGNHLLIYTRSKNLPDAYVESLARELYGLPISIVISEDHQATAISDRAQYLDVLYRTLPEGVYVRDLKEGDSGYEVSLSYSSGVDKLPEGMIAQLQSCSALPVQFIEIPLDEGSSVLLDKASDRFSKRILARAMNFDRYLVDQREFERIFLEVFEQASKPPELVGTGNRRTMPAAIDLTHMSTFSVDSESTRIHEDAFSITPLSSGEYEIRINVSNAARLIPFGSACDVFARLRGEFNSVEIDGGESVFRFMDEQVRRELDLGVGKVCEVFSYSFRTDGNFQEIEGSGTLDLALIRNTKTFSREQLDEESGKTYSDPRIHLLEQFARRNSKFFEIPADVAKKVRARELVFGMMKIFNDRVGEKLKDLGVTVPVLSQDRVHYDVFKFSGPARSYQSLLSQRQLDAVLTGREPLTAEAINEQLHAAGTPAATSYAYQILLGARQLRGEDAEAPVRVTRQGMLMLRTPVEEEDSGASA